tara:strand:+ start:31 stop:318 length:288 start_codon:yes stop_codon:yes gene_type:complete
LDTKHKGKIMGIFIDTQTEDKQVYEILLSDNKWYRAKLNTYMIIDAFEIGFYNIDTEKYYLQTDMGKGVKIHLEDGSELICKLSEVKAFKIKYNK